MNCCVFSVVCFFLVTTDFVCNDFNQVDYFLEFSAFFFSISICGSEIDFCGEQIQT